MTDTNQLPQIPTLRPGDSHMESLIEAAIQGHASTREAMRWLVRQIVPPQARAQVQGEAATVAVDHFDNGPFEAYTNRIHPPVEIGTKLYTTPQPAQATQAEVTGLLEAFDEAVAQELPRVSHVEYDSHEICKHFASKVRAILALRPVSTFCEYCGGNDEDPVDHCMDCTRPAAVPMTGEQRVVVSFLLGEGDLNGASFGDPHNPTHGGQFWWRKHLRNAFGITAQAKKEGA